MAIYEYECRDCSHQFSEMRKIGDDAPPPCPACGSSQTRKLMSLFASRTVGGSSVGGCGHNHAGGGG